MNLCTNTYRLGRLSLAVLVLSAGMLLFCSPSYAEQWQLGETREVPGGYTVDGTNYPLIKGTFRFPSAAESNDVKFDVTAAFFYSDGFFAEDPCKYNPHLAAASMCMAMSGFYSNEGGTGRNADYSHKNKNSIQFLKDIGCSDIRTNIYNTIRPLTDSIGLTLGSKKLASGKTLLAVSLRGANYEREWASNFTLGQASDHNGEGQGFAEAADLVVQEIQNYISSHLNSDNYGDIVFWVAGYSRGGAAANLTAKRLVDMCYSKGITNPQIFAYCLEAPQGGAASAELPGANYNCIHNIINPDDLVPKLFPSYMAFKRYGVDHYIPGTEAGEISNGSDNTFSRTAVDKSVMLRHLKAVNESADSSHLKEQVPAYGLNITLLNQELTQAGADSYTSGDFTGLFAIGLHLYSKYSNSLDLLVPTRQSVWVNDFCDDFVGTLQSWLTLTRSVYTGGREMVLVDGKESVVSYGSVQQAARDFMTLFNDFPPDEREEFSKRITDWFTGDLLGTLDLVANFCNALGDYHTYSSGKKNMVKNKLIEWLKGSKCFDALSLTDAEKDRMLDYDLRTLIDLLMTYLSQDYRHPMYGVEGLAQFLTLLSSVDTVRLNHYPEVMMAWLRAQDSFYADETERVTRAGSSSVWASEDLSDDVRSEERVLAGCVPVDDITAAHGADYISLLPTKTYIEYTNGEVEEASITWDTVNYLRSYYNEDKADIDEYGEFAGWTVLSGDSHPEAAHLYVFTGRVNVPAGVSVIDERDAEVSVSVFVAGLPKMDAPSCLLPDGNYIGSITVSLDCREDAEVYCSVNGGGIVQYTGPFTLGVGGAVSEDYDVVAYTRSNGPDRADSRPVVWSYTLWQSWEALNGGDTRSTGSPSGGCEAGYGVCVLWFVLGALMVRCKVRG